MKGGTNNAVNDSIISRFRDPQRHEKKQPEAPPQMVSREASPSQSLGGVFLRPGARRRHDPRRPAELLPIEEGARPAYATREGAQDRPRNTLKPRESHPRKT